MRFSDVPDSLAVVLAAFMTTVILKAWSKKVTKEEHPFWDRVLDVLTAASGITTMVGLATTPFVGSLSRLVAKLIEVISKNTNDAVGIGINIVTIIVTIVLVGWLFLRYEKKEKVIDLVYLGLAVLGAGALFPWIQEGFQVWVSYPVALTWNIAVGIWETILGARIELGQA